MNLEQNKQALDNRLAEGQFFAGMTGASTSQLTGMARNNNAFRRFDRDKKYTLQEILGILREERVIGNGLPGRIYFAWLNYKGIEYDYRAWLHFRKQPDGNYKPDFRMGAIGP